MRELEFVINELVDIFDESVDADFLNKCSEDEREELIDDFVENEVHTYFMTRSVDVPQLVMELSDKGYNLYDYKISEFKDYDNLERIMIDYIIEYTEVELKNELI